jgi:SsrA-binding protein
MRAMEIVNRKVKYEYHFVSTLEAGIVLTGTEVKSLRAGEAHLSDAWCLFVDNELYIKNMHISEYKFGTTHQHEPKRTRKLLLKKAELKKLQRRVTEKGFSIVPFRIFFNDRGIAKCEIALARGKKAYDKRVTIKDRDLKRELERENKLQP